jgi:hypothetical protein
MLMRVQFYKLDSGRLCSWTAAPPKRRVFQGTTMAAGRGLPHDLNQFVVERELEIANGFWGLLAHGASFASVPERRPTQPGRALTRAHRDELMAVEAIVNGHYQAWQRGSPTPLKAALDVMYARWLSLHENEPLILDWPIRPLPGRTSSRRAPI